MDARERLRRAGWCERQIAACLADATEDETNAIATSATEAELRQTLDAMADRRNAPTELEADDA